jgi:hypothetical protein
VRRWRRRLPGFLFVGCLVLAAGLVLLVLAAPALDKGGDWPAEPLPRAVALFARDVTLRRTALGSAAGLVATALVFFRPQRTRPPHSPTDVVGA